MNNPTKTEIKKRSTEILIIGGGPAGLTAGLYSSRAGKNTLILERRTGSRLSVGYQIENYPGFISIKSQELLEKFRSHAQHFNAEILVGEVIDFDLISDPKVVVTRDSLIEAKAVIIATGKTYTKGRMIPGEEKMLGMGVSYCATCDGPLFRSRNVVVIGNTEEAAEDVLALHELGCLIHWIPGEPRALKADEKIISEIKKKDISIYYNHSIKEIFGENRVEKVIMEREGRKEELQVEGVFIFREFLSFSLFSKAGITLDHRQCVITDRLQRTNLEGVFAAGDVTCGGMQVVTAAGEGAVAAMQAVKYLRK